MDLKWTIVCFVLSVVYFTVFLSLYCYQPSVLDNPDITIDEVLRTAKPGDLIINVYVSKHVSQHRLRKNIIRIGTSDDRNHCGVVVNYDGELHVFDIIPNVRLHPFVKSENPYNTGKDLRSGYIPLRDFLTQISTKNSLRRCKPGIIDNAKLLEVCKLVEKTCKKTERPITNWIRRKFQSTEKIVECDNVTCVEGVAFMYQQLGFNHPGFARGMNLDPFLETKSNIFDGKTLRIENNEHLKNIA